MCVRVSVPQVLLVTNDVANLKLARSEGLEAVTMREFVRSVSGEAPGLNDLLSAAAPEGDGGAADSTGRDGPAHLYPAHFPMSRIQEGLRTGKLLSGTLRLNRDCWFEGTVGAELPNGDFMSITISGREAVSRATEVPHPLPPCSARVCMCVCVRVRVRMCVRSGRCRGRGADASSGGR